MGGQTPGWVGEISQPEYSTSLYSQIPGGQTPGWVCEISRNTATGKAPKRLTVELTTPAGAVRVCPSRTETPGWAPLVS